MTYLLRFKLQHMTYPYPDWEGSQNEGWGSFSLYLINESEKMELLAYQWNLDVLADWYINNQEQMCNNPLSSYVAPGESLSQALNRLLELFDDEVDQEIWLTMLSNFRAAHSIRFALPGCRVPPIIIGCNNGIGEISLYLNDNDSKEYQLDLPPTPLYKEGVWSYKFDIRDFQNQFKLELQSFLLAWKQQTKYQRAKIKADDLLNRLSNNDTSHIEN